MRTDKADELTHEFVIQLHLLCPFVEWSTLGDIPFAHQVHHIVIPTYVGFDNLTRTRVDDTGTVGILSLGRQIAQETVAGIIRTDITALRNFLSHDGIFEARCLEGHIPVIDTLHQIGHPLLGRGRVDIINDLLLRLGEFAGSISLGVFRLQTIALRNGIVL